ncbi:hypothetical protein CCACVL1_19542 [Corchorus capsularis]|uniref:C2H2-type domain-containing protein n=1 Tax=Corchorus capsularis TaxID=210143 RepID=A0A1R3HGA6_COCAP|nr:hypothetical protein CCACVL1_19542 [Corchorus capsularis]
MTNQPHQALNILNNVNKNSSSTYEVIDVNAYDSEVYSNSSRANENQLHWLNQVKNDVIYENPSINLAKHGSTSINASVNSGVRENSINANDGRIHSLPRGDNGGYYCPLLDCENLVFQTTQEFAAHASSTHHSAETSEERQRRDEARFGKRKLSLGLTKGGISVMPDKLNFKSIKLGKNQSNSQWENDGGRANIAVGGQDIKPRILPGININY